jgi:pyruvate dehydrogenase E2 component (dihydrolipoamide acetyltransferase)
LRFESNNFGSSEAVAIERILVPDLGDASDVEVIELLVAVGDTVAEEDSLLVLESDKAAMEIPAPKSGVVKSLEINLGDKVSSGSVILTLEVEDVDDEVEVAEAVPLEQSEAEPVVEKTPAPISPAAAVPSIYDIKVPDIGTDDEVEVIEIQVAVGDSLSLDDTLITLESDKAAMDVPADRAGEVQEILVKVGDKVKKGASIVRILAEPVEDAPAATASDAEVAIEPKAAEPQTSDTSPADLRPAASVAPVPTPSGPVPGGDSAKVYAGPAVRKLARELGVDLTLVRGSGAKSRIIKEDIHGFVKTRINSPLAASSSIGIAPVPDIDFSQFGEIEEIPRSKLHKLTAANMQRNWNAVPHVAQFNEIDISDLEEFRTSLKGEAEKKGVRMTFLPFLLKACASALAELPQFNVSLHSSGEYVVQKKYIHIGVAVATEAGLVVPVIRNVDKKSLWELAAEVIELSQKAKDRKLSREEMQGACFTISSLGAIGGTGFIPIVNAPEVAILGVAKTQIKPQYVGGQFVPRQMLPITLSYDHKAVNGVDGGLFVTHLEKVLSDIRNLIL